MSGFVRGFILEGSMVSTVLAHERYPEDRATGLKLHDLRSVFWIGFPLEKSP